MSIVIAAKNISFSYGETEILKDISFDVKRGSVSALIGPNGSGKTTLLRVLMGFLKPQQGSITILGKTPPVIRHQIGYVPQRFNFDRTFPITIEEFMRFSCPDCSLKKIKQNLKHLDLDNKYRTQLGSLSGGQLQRVLVARALLRNPKVLMLDEPASGIDIGGEKNFYELVTHASRAHNTTTVIVSHELNIVYRFTDQVICINKRLVCDGPPKKVLTTKVLQKLYGPDVSIHDYPGGHAHA